MSAICRSSIRARRPQNGDAGGEPASRVTRAASRLTCTCCRFPTPTSAPGAGPSCRATTPPCCDCDTPSTDVRRGADFHLLLGVALRDLLGRLGVDDLVAHADDPHAARFARVHRADGRAADRARLRAAARAAEHAEQARHLAERAAVEARLRGGDLLGLQDVELDDVLGGLELAHLQELARGIAGRPGCRRASNSFSSGAEVRALEHLEVGGRQLDLAEVGDVVRRELLQERRVVALDLAGDARSAPGPSCSRSCSRPAGRSPGRPTRWPFATSRCPRWATDCRTSAAPRRRPPAASASAERGAGRVDEVSGRCHRGLLSIANASSMRRGHCFWDGVRRRRRRPRCGNNRRRACATTSSALLVDERQRHPRDVRARVRRRLRVDVRDDPAVAAGQRECHVHRHLVDRHHRILRGLRRDQAAQDEARAEALRDADSVASGSFLK